VFDPMIALAALAKWGSQAERLARGDERQMMNSVDGVTRQ
jgi:hypothetical protein